MRVVRDRAFRDATSEWIVTDRGLIDCQNSSMLWHQSPRELLALPWPDDFTLLETREWNVKVS